MWMAGTKSSQFCVWETLPLWNAPFPFMSQTCCHVVPFPTFYCHVLICCHQIQNQIHQMQHLIHCLCCMGSSIRVYAICYSLHPVLLTFQTVVFGWKLFGLCCDCWSDGWLVWMEVSCWAGDPVGPWPPAQTLIRADQTRAGPDLPAVKPVRCMNKKRKNTPDVFLLGTLWRWI